MFAGCNDDIEGGSAKCGMASRTAPFPVMLRGIRVA